MEWRYVDHEQAERIPLSRPLRRSQMIDESGEDGEFWLKRALQNLRDAQAAQREGLAGRRQQIAAERESAVLERDRASKAVNPALLARYDRIRRGKAPLAIFPLHGSSCGNCFTAVPTQRKALIQRGATIEGCEACGVLLYAKE